MKFQTEEKRIGVGGTKFENRPRFGVEGAQNFDKLPLCVANLGILIFYGTEGTLKFFGGKSL